MGRYSNSSVEAVNEVLKAIPRDVAINHVADRIVEALKDMPPLQSLEVARVLQNEHLIYDDSMFLQAFNNLITCNKVRYEHREGWVLT